MCFAPIVESVDNTMYLFGFPIQENECVVESALADFGFTFELVHILPEWDSRGLPVFRGGN